MDSQRAEFLALRINEITQLIKYQVKVSEGIQQQFVASEEYLGELRETLKSLESLVFREVQNG